MQPDAAAGFRVFSRTASIERIPLWGEHCCWVIDGALSDPDAAAAQAASRRFSAPAGYPYPGLVADVPGHWVGAMSEFFARTLRSRMGARRTLDTSARLSLVTLAPEQLEPRQWQCHRDRIAADPEATLFAASVLYLFRNAALGGTSFYRPRLSAEQTNRMVADSQALDAERFAAAYGLHASYMTDSNAYFERVASVPAAWNRMIAYDGSLFHSADIDRPQLMSAQPAAGRLTLNGFFTCRRNAR